MKNLSPRVHKAFTFRRCSAGLEGYGEPPPADRLAAHADAARLCLVCVHAFRPAPEGLLEALLARVGAGAPSCLIFDPEHANV